MIAFLPAIGVKLGNTVLFEASMPLSKVPQAPVFREEASVVITPSAAGCTSAVILIRLSLSTFKLYKPECDCAFVKSAWWADQSKDLATGQALSQLFVSKP